MPPLTINERILQLERSMAFHANTLSASDSATDLMLASHLKRIKSVERRVTEMSRTRIQPTTTVPVIPTYLSPPLDISIATVPAVQLGANIYIPNPANVRTHTSAYVPYAYSPPLAIPHYCPHNVQIDCLLGHIYKWSTQHTDMHTIVPRAMTYSKETRDVTFSYVDAINKSFAYHGVTITSYVTLHVTDAVPTWPTLFAPLAVVIDNGTTVRDVSRIICDLSLVSV
jgi:hypothetical protein